MTTLTYQQIREERLLSVMWAGRPRPVTHGIGSCDIPSTLTSQGLREACLAGQVTCVGPLTYRQISDERLDKVVWAERVWPVAYNGAGWPSLGPILSPFALEIACAAGQVERVPTPTGLDEG